MKRLKFNNRAIHNHKSNFVSSTGKSKVRVYTPFQMHSLTHFKGLNLCEYKKGEKHFVLIFFIKGQRNKKRLVNLDVINEKTYNVLCFAWYVFLIIIIY